MTTLLYAFELLGYIGIIVGLGHFAMGEWDW